MANYKLQETTEFCEGNVYYKKGHIYKSLHRQHYTTTTHTHIHTHTHTHTHTHRQAGRHTQYKAKHAHTHAATVVYNRRLKRSLIQVAISNPA